MFGDDGERPQADDAPRGRAEDRLSGWADRLTERMESFGDRFSEAMAAAFSARPFGKHDTVERDLAVDGALPVSVAQLRRQDRGEGGRIRPRARDARSGTAGPKAIATRSPSTSTVTTAACTSAPGARFRRATAGRTSPSPSPRRRRCSSPRKAVRSASTTSPAPWSGRPEAVRCTSTGRWATRRSRPWAAPSPSPGTGAR